MKPCRLIPCHLLWTFITCLESSLRKWHVLLISLVANNSNLLVYSVFFFNLEQVGTTQGPWPAWGSWSLDCNKVQMWVTWTSRWMHTLYTGYFSMGAACTRSVISAPYSENWKPCTPGKSWAASSGKLPTCYILLMGIFHHDTRIIWVENQKLFNNNETTEIM